MKDIEITDKETQLFLFIGANKDAYNAYLTVTGQESTLWTMGQFKKHVETYYENRFKESEVAQKVAAKRAKKAGAK